MNTSHPRFTPEATPLPLRQFLIGLGLINALSGLFFKTLSPLLALSLPAIEQGWIWQLATYPFVLGSPLSWWALLILAFELFILWIYSTPILALKGIRFFFLLLLGSTITAGLAGLTAMTFSPGILSGLAPLLFSVLTSWALLYKNTSVWIFGFSLNARKLLLGFMGFDLLIHLSQEHWIALFSNGTGVLFGILYCNIPILISSVFKAKKLKNTNLHKIYDIQSGKPVLNDDQFMDVMLERISRYGEDSLTPSERQRMLKISQLKAFKNPRNHE